MRKTIKLIAGVLVLGMASIALVGCGAKASFSADASGEVQNIVSKVESRGYEPITVKAGVPVKWTLQAEKKDLNGCNNTIMIPEYKIVKKLNSGDNVIEFTPTKSGVVPFSCWMGMINSEINVVDELPEVGQTKLAAVADNATSQITQESAVSNVNGVVDAKIAANGYPEIVVEVGKTTKLNFRAEQSDLNSCNNEILMPDFGIDKVLEVGDNFIEITPDKVGEFEYTCWMGMIRSKIVVVESGSTELGAKPMDEAAFTANASCPMMGGLSANNVNDNPGGCCAVMN